MSTDSPSDARLLKCPSCGATIEVVDAPSVQCRYCGSNVPIPAEYRPQPPQPRVIIQRVETPIDYTKAATASSRAGCLIGAVIVVITLGIIGFSFLSSTHSPLSAVLNPGAATVVQAFGDQGSGPGLLDDPRYVAIDSDNNIWVADYQDGRVQKFDATGKFKLLVQIPADSNDNTLIDGLAADLQGNIYVTRGGDILKYKAADGTLLKTILGSFPDTRYQGMAVDATNTLYVVHTTASDNSVIKLDANGQKLQRWDEMVTSVNKKDAAMELSVALDGVGNIYLSSFFGKAVYIFDKNGKYVSRFSSQQDAQDSGSPGQIAIDGKNNVYLDNFGTIKHFDIEGRYQNSLPTDYAQGTPMGLTVDRAGFIYVVTNKGKVLKYQLAGK